MLEQNAVHLASPDTYIKCAIQRSVCPSVRPASHVCSVAPTVFSCDQAALLMVFSVRHTFLTMFQSSYHHEIFRSYYQWQKWCPCKKSRSEVKGQGHRGKQMVKFDPDWAFPDCNSSLNSPMATKWWTKLEVGWKRCPIVFQGHPSNFKVTRL